LVSAVAWIAAPTIIDVVAGGGFEDSVDVLRIVVLASIGYALSAIMAPQWIGRGLFGLASGLTVRVAVLNVAANLILIPREAS
jgi:O-antigen/teichoic acid export membrane protein